MKQFMTFFRPYTKIIIFLLGMAILMPSCTIYKSKSSTVEDAVGYDNWRMKVNTIHGNVIKLRWIEEKNENIVSIKDTKRVMIENSKIQMIKIGQDFISLDSARNHIGKVQIYTKNRNYSFLRIQVEDDYTIGIEKTGKEILPVVIPKDQIEKIKVKNKGLSTAGTIGLGLVIVYIIALVF